MRGPNYDTPKVTKNMTFFKKVLSMVHIKPRKKKEGSDPVPPLREATQFSLEGSAPVSLVCAIEWLLHVLPDTTR